MFWKYLRDQGGQFWGGFAGGVYQAYKDQQAQQMKREELDLRKKMLDSQIKQHDLQAEFQKFNLNKAQQQEQNLNALSDLFTKGVTEPETQVPAVQPETGGIEQPEPGTPGTLAEAPSLAQSTFKVPARQRPATKEELLGAAVKADPAHAMAQVVKGLVGGEPGADMLFHDWQSAMNFQTSPEFQNMFPFGATAQQTAKGIQFKGNQVSNPNNATWHQVYERTTGTPDQKRAAADQAMQGTIYGGRSAAGGGYTAGRAAQELGEPVAPFVGMQPGQPGTPAPMTPPPGTPMAPGIVAGREPGTVTKAPPEGPNQSYPTSGNKGSGAAAGSQIQRAHEQRARNAANVKETTPLNVKEVGKLWRVNPQTGEPEQANPRNGWTSESAKAAGFVEPDDKIKEAAQALKPAEAQEKMLMEPLARLYKENETFMGRRSNQLGASGLSIPGFGTLGSESQALLGASTAGDDVKAGWLNFMQHYEKVTAGLRGASSPELQKIMEARGPQAGMTPHQIAQRVTYMHNILVAMKQGIIDALGGGSYGGQADMAVLANPDTLTPDQRFMDLVNKHRKVETIGPSRSGSWQGPPPPGDWKVQY